jgi:hypothetical protein
MLVGPDDGDRFWGLSHNLRRLLFARACVHRKVETWREATAVPALTLCTARTLNMSYGGLSPRASSSASFKKARFEPSPAVASKSASSRRGVQKLSFGGKPRLDRHR